MAKWSFKDKEIEKIVSDSEKQDLNARIRAKHAQERLLIRKVNNCIRCGDFIAPTKQKHSVYCSIRCRKLAGSKKRYHATNPKVLVLEFLGNKCAICDSTKELHIDHIKALKDGGEHKIANVQLLCRTHHHEKTMKEISHHKIVENTIDNSKSLDTINEVRRGRAHPRKA